MSAVRYDKRKKKKIKRPKHQKTAFDVIELQPKIKNGSYNNEQNGEKENGLPFKVTGKCDDTLE